MEFSGVNTSAHGSFTDLPAAADDVGPQRVVDVFRGCWAA